MFHKIQELIDDSDVLVCVLIDEVSGTLKLLLEQFTSNRSHNGRIYFYFALSGLPHELVF